MQPMVYTPAMQAVGQFDGGKITEQKPIGFPGEGSVVKRVGPLFYWAWAESNADALIGLHPHQGFEIMSYVVQGTGVHGDTLGTNSTIGAGGAQVMQTGSGVSHREQLVKDTELFQIWFEPELKEAVKRQPTYRQYAHEEFPNRSEQGYQVKTVIGEGAPIELVTDAGMWDVEINPGGAYSHQVQSGYVLTALAIRGNGRWANTGAPTRYVDIKHKDFIVGKAESLTTVNLENTGEANLRLILIVVPAAVDYELLRKR
ncbi:pirin family protein [Paenibacillus sp. SI8]|uniref:pirin family protein n=1 Tax=unclassified Paenibacillus TaxID=185978 RepID=UPI0034661EA9